MSAAAPQVEAAPAQAQAADAMSLAEVQALVADYQRTRTARCWPACPYAGSEGQCEGCDAYYDAAHNLRSQAGHLALTVLALHEELSAAHGAMDAANRLLGALTASEPLVAHLALMLRTSAEHAALLGRGTPTFPLLVAAFAAQNDATPTDVEPLLAECRDTTEPRAVVLQRRVEALEAELVEARARATALETEALAAETARGSR